MTKRQITLLSSAALVSFVGAISVVGCGGSDQPAKSPDEATSAAAMTPPSPAAPSEPVSPVGASTTGREGDPAQSPPAALAAGNGPAPTEAAPMLTDDQILEITHTANAGEIEQAKLAQAKSKDAKVKKFAAMMVKDHTDADTKGMKLAKKASLKPTSTPTSTSLASDADSNTTAMKTATGADFDKAYIDAQVKEHQAVLDTIDQKLVPNAKNADVKAYLAEVRTAVAMHLQHAKDMQTALAK